MSFLDIYVAQAEEYWRTYLGDEPISGPPILVDMMHSNSSTSPRD